MSMRIIEINPSIRADVEASNGYCPCAIYQTPDTRCMCKEFRDQTEPGPCGCGRYEKITNQEANDSHDQAGIENHH